MTKNLSPITASAVSTLDLALSDYTFNAKGQRTKVHAGSQPAALTWQGERLLSFETSDTRANYAYDTSGMRIKADLTSSSGASQTLRYTHDGLRLLEVSSKSSTDTSNFSLGYLYEADNQTPSAASYETRLLTNATECIDESLAHAIAHNQPLRYAGYVYDEYSQMYYCAALLRHRTHKQRIFLKRLLTLARARWYY